jgi:hypothetical protein
MAIWVDADACPKPIKEILFRAATRTQIEVALVANQMLAVPRSPWIRSLQVPEVEITPSQCEFQGKLDSDSKAIWTLIPRQTGQSNVIT